MAGFRNWKRNCSRSSTAISARAKWQGKALRGEQTEAASHAGGAEEIAEVVSRATGIPVSKMMQGEREKLLHMEQKLHEPCSRPG